MTTRCTLRANAVRGVVRPRTRDLTSEPHGDGALRVDALPRQREIAPVLRSIAAGGMRAVLILRQRDGKAPGEVIRQGHFEPYRGLAVRGPQRLAPSQHEASNHSLVYRLTTDRGFTHRVPQEAIGHMEETAPAAK